ncbi:hypothetical protein V2G26_017418 [Clonostachys chloroleuca]
MPSCLLTISYPVSEDPHVYTLTERRVKGCSQCENFSRHYYVDGRTGEWYEHELRLRGGEVGALECCGCYPPLDKGFKRDKLP